MKNEVIAQRVLPSICIAASAAVAISMIGIQMFDAWPTRFSTLRWIDVLVMAPTSILFVIPAVTLMYYLALLAYKPLRVLVVRWKEAAGTAGQAELVNLDPVQVRKAPESAVTEREIPSKGIVAALLLSMALIAISALTLGALYVTGNDAPAEVNFAVGTLAVIAVAFSGYPINWVNQHLASQRVPKRVSNNVIDLHSSRAAAAASRRTRAS